MANVWRQIDARPSLETIGTILQDIVWAMDGKTNRGLPLTLTKYTGTQYALDVQSAETSAGNAFRARSQNTTYGITLNNTGLTLIGDITASASLYMSGTLNVGGAATVSGVLLVGGAATFNSDLTAGGRIWSVGTLVVGATASPVASVSPTTGDIASIGKLALTPAAAHTTFKRQIESTFTWNNGTTAMNAMILSLTDTASGTTSTFFECLAGGTNKFSLDKSGFGIFGAGVAALGALPHPATGAGVEIYYVPGGNAGVLRAFDWAGATYSKAMILAGNPLEVGLTTSHSLGFYGSVGTAQQAVSAAAASSASALTLVNDLRAALVALNLVR